MNKKEVLKELISVTEKEMDLLKTTEYEDLKTITRDQREENLFENTTEEEIRSISQKSAVLDDLVSRLNHLNAIDANAEFDAVSHGALIKLNTGIVLVSAAFPGIKLDEVTVTGISEESPLFQKMKGLKKGAQFHLTGHDTEFVILEIL